jgi:hypothetical protein
VFAEMLEWGSLKQTRLMTRWETVRLCIVVKTYPVVDERGEAVCMAGVTDDGRPIRLFPVRFRSLPAYARFQKFQWFTARITKSSDSRPESHELDSESIRDLAPQPISTALGWRERNRVVAPFRAQSIEDLAIRRATLGQSLGLVRPASISGLRLVHTGDGWTEKQLNRLRQMAMFAESPKGELQKIPYEFRYRWRCADDTCRSHDMELLDWEVAESYRGWRRRYGMNWEAQLRHRYEDELLNKYDTQWFVGTFAKYPDNWTLIGWYRPPRNSGESEPQQLELLEH